MPQKPHRTVYGLATKRQRQYGAGKSHQLLEKRFPDTKFSWVEFPAGPQMLEALNVGSIDLGSTGDIPPIFAQAAGADWYTSV